MDPLRLAEAQGVEFALLSHTVGHSIQFRVFWQCTPQTLTKPIIKHHQLELQLMRYACMCPGWVNRIDASDSGPSDGDARVCAARARARLAGGRGPRPGAGRCTLCKTLVGEDQWRISRVAAFFAAIAAAGRQGSRVALITTPFLTPPQPPRAATQVLRELHSAVPPPGTAMCLLHPMSVLKK